jgi:uncharacterized membrane protein YczE
MHNKRTGQVVERLIIYYFGLMIMMLGIVFFIKSDLGATPWDVLHVGLFHHFGLTIGTWSIIVGILILTASAIIAQEIPHIGAFLNMISCGIIMDLYMMLPFMVTPHTLLGKLIMFFIGIGLNAYGMGLYISASLGAGPRDSLMLALTNKTGWKVRNVRAAIEVIVLIIGWRLGGPANLGTFVYGFIIGPVAGAALPQTDKLTSRLLQKWRKQDANTDKNGNQMNRRGVN